MSILSGIPTGNVIKNYLDENGINQKDLSKRIGVSEKHISHLLNGESRLTEEMALKLEKVLPVKASYWLNYESKYREALAREKESSNIFSSEEELKILAKKFHFKEVFKGLNWNLQKQADEMLKLLRISSFSNFENTYSELAVSFMEDGGSLESIAIWLNLCREDIEVQNNNSEVDYKKNYFKKHLPELKAIANNPKPLFSINNARKWLNQMGINLVVEDQIVNCKVRGAITCYKKTPSIFLSLRFKTHDHAWFALLHEIGHLLMHFNGNSPYISYMDEEKSKDIKEEEANKFARDFFINPEEYDDFIKNTLISQADIVRFAINQNIQPGIVLARLQHDGIIPYTKYNSLKTRF